MSRMNILRRKISLACIMLFIVFSVFPACSGDDSSEAADGDFEAGPETENDIEGDIEAGSENEPEADGDEETSEVETDTEEASTMPFRVAVISDTHIVPNMDKMPNQNFIAFGQYVDGLDPKPAYVISTGDNVEDMLCMPDVTCEDPPAILTTFRKLIEDNYTVPFRFVLGNHDNRFLDMYGGNELPLSMWSKAFEGSDLYPGPYYYFDHNGFRFVMLFGSDAAIDHDTNDMACFGSEQLEWLDGLLSDGLPSLLFWHQMIDPVAEMQKETPNAILGVIEAHKNNVKAVFGGHGHVFARIEWNGVIFYETAALGRGVEVGTLQHHLLECDPVGGTVTVVNAADIVYPGGI